MSPILIISYLLSFVASILQILYIPTLSMIVLQHSYTTLDIGLISGAASVIYTAGSAFSSMVTRTKGEKNVITLSLVLLLLSYILMSYVHSREGIFFTAAIGLLSYSLFWPSIETIISTNKGSVSAFSFSWSSGTLFGSILASLTIIVDAETLLKSYALLTLTMIIFSLKLSNNVKKIDEKPNLSDMIKALTKLASSWKLSFAYAASLGGILAYYPVIVEVNSFPVWNVSTLFFSMILARTIIFFLYDRIKGTSLKPLYGSALLLASLAIPFIPDALAVVFLGVLAGCGQGILYAISLEKAFTTEEHLRTVYTGLFEASIGLGYSLGPLIGGIFSQPLIELSIIASTLLAIIISLLP